MTIALLAAVAFGSAATTADAASGRASLRIVAPVGMRFLTRNLSPGAFTGSRTFNNLKPGTYTVVPAPPAGGGLVVSCTNGGGQQQTLAAGDDVTCTFSLAAG